MCYKQILSILILSLFMISLQSCGGRQRNDSKESNEKNANNTEETKSYTYNFYVENSGSVKGYFKGKSNDAGVLIKEYYDRIDEKLKVGEKITLNYINNSIIKQKGSIDNFLKNIYVNCNQAFSDLDKVLEQTLLNTDDQTINLVISDYCFESKDGDLRKAQSGITKIFTKALDKNKDLSVAIYKYEASFDGFYFPGRIKFMGKRPLYLWLFGPSEALKKISNLNIEQKCENAMFLQSPQSYTAKVQTKNKRMKGKEEGCLIVKYWKEDKYDAGLYKVDLKVTLNKLMLPSSAIVDKKNYQINSNDYYLENIKKINDTDYVFTIATEHPSPSKLEISYSLEIPKWVVDSNFEQNTLPKDSTTYGIKYLIEGVSNAYANKNNNIFNINLTIK